MSAASVRERLAGGPARGLGCAAEVAAAALEDASVLQEVVEALRDERPVVVARAANVFKKVHAKASGMLDMYANELIQTALGCKVPEARWNLILVLGSLPLTDRDRTMAVDLFFGELCNSNVFLRVSAMQALADLSRDDTALRLRVRGVIARALEDESRAVRARARVLTKKMRHGPPQL